MEDIKPVTCMTCPNHKVVPDPDPEDWFCSDDVAVLCTITDNTNDSKAWASQIPFEHRPITTSCRPYNTENECAVPSWCPLKRAVTLNKFIQLGKEIIAERTINDNM